MSIGQALRAAREDAGLTQEEVAQATRLRTTLVKAIENDDHALCGGDVYARGHIRNLANVIGLDPAPLLAEFDADRSPNRLTTPADAFDPRVSSAAGRRRPPNWSAAMLVVLVLLVGYGGVRLLHGNSSHAASLVDRGASAPLAGASTSPAPTASAAAGPTAAGSTRPRTTKPATVAPSRRPGMVQVQVTAPNGASWVRATGHDGHRIWEGTVARGATKAFTDATQLSLVIGNAGAVTLQVNGRAIGSPGSRGEVATVSYTTADPA